MRSEQFDSEDLAIKHAGAISGCAIDVYNAPAGATYRFYGPGLRTIGDMLDRCDPYDFLCDVTMIESLKNLGVNVRKKNVGRTRFDIYTVGGDEKGSERDDDHSDDSVRGGDNPGSSGYRGQSLKQRVALFSKEMAMLSVKVADTTPCASQRTGYAGCHYNKCRHMFHLYHGVQGNDYARAAVPHLCWPVWRFKGEWWEPATNVTRLRPV